MQLNARHRVDDIEVTLLVFGRAAQEFPPGRMPSLPAARLALHNVSAANHLLCLRDFRFRGTVLGEISEYFLKLPLRQGETLGRQAEINRPLARMKTGW